MIARTHYIIHRWHHQLPHNSSKYIDSKYLLLICPFYKTESYKIQPKQSGKHLDIEVSSHKQYIIGSQIMTFQIDPPVCSTACLSLQVKKHESYALYFVRGSNNDRFANGQYCGNHFHVMTSSCYCTTHLITGGIDWSLPRVVGWSERHTTTCNHRSGKRWR